MADPPAPAPARQRTVFARHAASLLVVRDTASGPEVLMGVRGQGHRFMPNRLVFPGGAVDPGDGAAPAASEPNPGLLAILTRRAGPRLARGIVVCAARELEEETGLSLGSPPHLSAMHYLCRAVTPPASPIRFNARFLVVSSDAVTGSLQDTTELGALGFRKVSDALEIDLAVATSQVLQRFQLWWAERKRTPVLPFAPMVFHRRTWMDDA